MAFKFVSKPHNFLHLPPTPFQFLRKVVARSLATVEAETSTISEQFSTSIPEQDSKKGTAWKRLNSKELGIQRSMIGRTVKKVLNGLKKKGYDVYLVGGCVRDLILKQTPKDFDIITSAELEEVMRTFSWCNIVDKRVPVCHVHMDGIIVEVSSFNTARSKVGMEFSHDTEAPNGCDKEDHLRWMNCLNRDFTINGLMFDPYAKTVYDYTGGAEDIRKAKVRTVIPAATSFQKDCGEFQLINYSSLLSHILCSVNCIGITYTSEYLGLSDSVWFVARILRAIGIAAHLGFIISKKTSYFINNMSLSVLSLDRGRILKEMNYMLAYGYAEASLRLLWKFGLLDIVLPFQAAYFVCHGFHRGDKRTNLLLSLFSNLDKLLAPNRPCHHLLWVGILAFHKTLSDRPRDPLVVVAFTLAVHLGGNLLEATHIARMINKPHDARFPELLNPSILDAEALEAEILDLAESVRGSNDK